MLKGIHAIAAAAPLMLSGCVTSPIVILDKDNYFVTVHAITSMANPRDMRARAAAAADDFCAKSGKSAHIKSSFDTGITGTGSLVFTCESAEDKPALPIT